MTHWLFISSCTYIQAVIGAAFVSFHYTSLQVYIYNVFLFASAQPTGKPCAQPEGGHNWIGFWQLDLLEETCTSTPHRDVRSSTQIVLPIERGQEDQCPDMTLAELLRDESKMYACMFCMCWFL